METTRSFPAYLSELSSIRAFIRQQAAQCGLPREMTDDTVLAVSEACGNAVRHSASRTVQVTWMILSGGVAVEVQDEGRFRPTVGPMAAAGGWGFPVMLGLMDEVTVRPGDVGRPGTLVRLVKRTAELR